jgi:hypothetical protein
LIRNPVSGSKQGIIHLYILMNRHQDIASPQARRLRRRTCISTHSAAALMLIISPLFDFVSQRLRAPN